MSNFKVGDIVVVKDPEKIFGCKPNDSFYFGKWRLDTMIGLSQGV